MHETNGLNAIVAAHAAEGHAGHLDESSREVELKFLADESTFARMLASPQLAGDGNTAPTYLNSTYYDTTEGNLRRHGIVLRMRNKRGQHVLTVKWAGKSGSAAFERGEIEAAAPSSEPDPAVLGANVQAEIHRVTEGRRLHPLFATKIERVSRQINVGSAVIEAAFDSGFIVAGDKKTPVREIELELKAGHPADLFEFGLSLAEEFPICLGIATKGQRGLLLSCGVHASAVQATPPDLAGQTEQQAIETVLRNCMDHFITNWLAFDGPEKAEAIRQISLALQRLHDACRRFGRHYPCAEFLRFAAEAERLATIMGEAGRQAVFEEHLHDTSTNLDARIADAAAETQVGHRAIARLLSAPSTTRFVLAVEVFIARRGWM